MRSQTRLVLFVLVAALLGGAILHCLASRQLALTQSDLTLGRLPPPPPQPITLSIQCTRGLVVTFGEISGDWFLSRDHPPCTVGSDFVLPVKAMAAEMAALKHRPRLVFKVAASGEISNAFVSRTSGSQTLDERSMKLVLAHRYNRHNCGVCTVSTEVGVDHQGPVWIRESLQ